MLMKLVKRLVVLVVVLVVLVGAGAFGVLVYADSIVKTAVEKGGTYAFGVPTKLANADVGLISGKLGLDGLDVNNPTGYKSASFMTMGHGGIEVSLGTLRSEVVEVPRLEISDVQVNLEKAEGKANYQVILDNLKKLESGEKPASTEKSEKKYVIKEVHVKNVKVHVDLLPVGGTLTQANITLDAVYLKDIGTAGKGVPLSELASIIVKAVMSAIADKGGGVIPADLLGDLQGKLAELKNLDQLGVIATTSLEELKTKTLDNVKKDVEQKVDDVKKDVEKKIEEGLKGLIPGKK